MPYGPLTNKHIAKLDAGEVFTSAGGWNPDDFTLPFPERFAVFVGEYCDLPADTRKQKAVLLASLRKGAEEKGIKVSRNTLNEWLNGNRDPSVSSSDIQTRENIYKICASLDYDYALTQEMFEKVFFSRAFNPKNVRELAFSFFAVRDYERGVTGCRWYREGQRIIEQVLGAEIGEAVGKTITDSSLILDQTAMMDEEAFITFLTSNPGTFTKKNENAAARKAVKETALKACSLSPEMEKISAIGELPYEALITRIIGFSQRSISGVGTVASLHALPPQLTTNFPTGQILRKICQDEECTYDQIVKMLSLLLFYCYFSRGMGMPVAQSFRGFLRFANLSLERAGCVELNPNQPYGGLLLFCAAQSDPLNALRTFLQEKMEEESEAVLQESMRLALPALTNRECLSLIRAFDRDPFLVKMTIGTMRRIEHTVKTENLIKQENSENFIQYLYDHANFSTIERALLRSLTLLPPEGVPDEFLGKLLDEREMTMAEELYQQNWLIHEKKHWGMDYRIRQVVNDQLDFPTIDNCKQFILLIRHLSEERLASEEQKLLEKIQKRIRTL